MPVGYGEKLERSAQDDLNVSAILQCNVQRVGTATMKHSADSWSLLNGLLGDKCHRLKTVCWPIHTTLASLYCSGSQSRSTFQKHACLRHFFKCLLQWYCREWQGITTELVWPGITFFPTYMIWFQRNRAEAHCKNKKCNIWLWPSRLHHVCSQV